MTLLGKRKLIFRFQLVYNMCDTRRSLLTLPLGFIGRLYAILTVRFDNSQEIDIFVTIFAAVKYK